MNEMKLAVSIDKVGNIPFDNPFFYRHLTAISPGSTAIISFEKNDPGLSILDTSSIEISEFSPRNLKIAQKFFDLYRQIRFGYCRALLENEIVRLSDFLITNGVKSVLAEEGPNGCSILPACRKAGIPLYTHFHGGDVGVGERSWKMRRAYRELAKHSAGIISPSHFLAEKLQKLGFSEDKMHVIPCGVSTNDFYPSEDKDERLLIAIGRFIPKKAPYRTVEAFSLVLKKFPDAKLEMIGTGRMLDSTIARAKELGVLDNIVFNSKNTDNSYVRQRLRQATVFVQHSVTAPKGDIEAFGITPVEAMASGVPPVVTRHNGFVETVVDGETGFLTPEHDVEAMANAIIKLLQNNKLRDKMGLAGRKRVKENFTDNLNVERLRDLLLGDFN